MNILIVAAHPDDETIGMGGTLKKISKLHQVTVLFMNDGVLGRRQTGFQNKTEYEISADDLDAIRKDVELRKKHAVQACKILGIQDVRFLNFPNVEMDAVPLLKIIKSLEKIIEELKPSIIFTHHYNDISIDHKLTYDATVTAARPLPHSKVSSIFSFELTADTYWKKPNKFNPTMFIDITNEIDAKIHALNAYEKELRKSPYVRNEETIRAIARRWGGIAGFYYAEPFEVVLHRTNKPFEII